MDSIRAGYANGTFHMVFDYYMPNDNEIAVANSGTPLEVRFKLIDNILFFMLKTSGISAVDAPFSPKFYGNVFEIAPISGRYGYPLIITIRDSATGRQIKSRMIGLGTEFSQKLYTTIMQQLNMPFSHSKYQSDIAQIYRKYTTDQIWDTADAQYIIGADKNQEIAIRNDISNDISFEKLVAERGEYIADDECTCIQCILECHREQAKGCENDYLIPIPISYLADKGYTIENGIIYTDAPYDDKLGVIIDDKYYD